MQKLRLILILMVLALGAVVACSDNGDQTPIVVRESVEAVDQDAIVRSAVATIDAGGSQAAVEQVSLGSSDAVTIVVTPEPIVIQEDTGALESNPSAAIGFALQDALVTLYDQVNPSVVFILVEGTSAAGFGSGSGFVFDNNGHIVTNNHVVENAVNVEVEFYNGQRRRAEVLGTDVDSDLAVLRVEDMPANMVPLPLADYSTVDVGQFVVAIGNPFGQQGSMSLGIVSALGRSLQSQRGLETGGSYSLPSVIQTDAPINPGNSGGPLVNLDGEVVGVNSAINTTTGFNSGVGFSIPVSAVERIAPALIEQGSYTYPYMGVQFHPGLTVEEADELGLPQPEGAYVIQVMPGTPADDAGLVGENSTVSEPGDLITSIDGVSISNFNDLNNYLVFETEPGQTIDMLVIRGNQEIVVPLTLGERP